MRVAIYVRVSTSDKGQTTENQEPELRAWAERQGATEVLTYRETASGSKSDRPELGRLLRDAHARRFDVVCVWALDRLSREGIGPMLAYMRKLSGAGVRVRSHQEPWLETTGPVAELLLAVFAWVAEQERERIRERVNAGLTRARKHGRVGGRRPVPLDAGAVRAAFLAAGGSYRKAAARLTYERAGKRVRCSPTTLRRYVLANPTVRPASGESAAFLTQSPV